MGKSNDQGGVKNVKCSGKRVEQERGRQRDQISEFLAIVPPGSKRIIALTLKRHGFVGLKRQRTKDNATRACDANARPGMWIMGSLVTTTGDKTALGFASISSENLLPPSKRAGWLSRGNRRD